MDGSYLDPDLNKLKTNEIWEQSEHWMIYIVITLMNDC